MSMDERHIVSNDADFWDPSDPSQKGNPSAIVSTLLGDQLDISVLLLGQLMDRLN